MKIEKIEMNKIKVTLSAADLIDMNISVKSITPNSPQLHEFLNNIMEKVREETGFNPYTGQIMVEATTSEDGIVLIVTKFREEKKRKIKNVRVAGRKNVLKNTYRFRHFENICKLFSAVDSDNFKTASLYEYMDNFYIIVNKGKILGISEFSDAGGYWEFSESFLEEHGKLHAKGEKLAAMAEGVKELMK